MMEGVLRNHTCRHLPLVDGDCTLLSYVQATIIIHFLSYGGKALNIMTRYNFSRSTVRAT